MENFNPGTLFIGQTHCFLQQTESTNVWLAEKLKTNILSEGFLVHADYQENGKGRLERTWRSDAGKNLMFSVYLRPAFIAVSNQSILSFLVALSVSDTVQSFVKSEVFVKWPNDVICENKKIAGILIENQLKGMFIDRVIAGIGLNVNQESFPDNIPGTSIAQITGSEISRKEVLETFCRHLEARYLQVKNAGPESLLETYNQRLYGRGHEVTVQMDDNTSNGVIRKVDKEGCINIVTNGVLNRYHFNSVKLIYHGLHS